MMTDPIADMLTRLRNAGLANLDRAVMPTSKLKENIAEILKKEGYIQGYEVDREQPATLSVEMKYAGDRTCAIAGIKRTSRPGRRVYVGYQGIPYVLDGLGVAIVSTSQGLMSDKTARSSKVGGEVLCEVW